MDQTLPTPLYSNETRDTSPNPEWEAWTVTSDNLHLQYKEVPPEVLDKYEEVDISPKPSPPIPMEGMPYNIPGGVHSPEAIPASEYVDREMTYNMTLREDLLSQDN